MSAPNPNPAPATPHATPSAPTFVRQSHDHDGDLAVFLIGMRVNQPWRPDLWLPVFGAMPGMLTELYAAKAAAARGEGPDLGFLDGRSLVGAGGPTLVQYWRSVDDIYAYANDPDHEHRPAMRAFYARSRRATRRLTTSRCSRSPTRWRISTSSARGLPGDRASRRRSPWRRGR